jgi:hypothetical protein
MAAAWIMPPLRKGNRSHCGGKHQRELFVHQLPAVPGLGIQRMARQPHSAMPAITRRRVTNQTSNLKNRHLYECGSRSG